MSDYAVDAGAWDHVAAVLRTEGIWPVLRVAGYGPAQAAAIETQLVWMVYLDVKGELPAGAMRRLIDALTLNLERDEILPDSMLSDFVDLLARHPAERSPKARRLPYVPGIVSLASLDRINGQVLRVMSNALNVLQDPHPPAVLRAA